MKIQKTIIFSAILSALCLSSKADEGMWMVNALDRVLEAKMQQAGLKLPAGVIYDEEEGGLCDAVVSLSFGCTGSVISDEGLVITNHHCAYGDLFALSSEEHNYLEDGFWAKNRSEEIPVKDGAMYFLRKVLDVTALADSMMNSHPAYKKPMGSRRLSHEIEKKFQARFPGKEVSLYSMWAGEKYYLMVYDVYKDVRIVAAPPVCVGSFGGDIDNWEWPQHKGDFAIYRIYTSPDGSPAEHSDANVPLRPRKKLSVSTKGVQKGDYTMTIGYPGTTNRYISSYELHNQVYATTPVSATFMKERMQLMNKWFDADPSLRLKYSDAYFMLSNVQEIRESLIDCVKDYDVIGKIADGQEKKLPKGLLDSMKTSFKKAEYYDRQTRIFQETGPRSGMFFKLAMRADRTADKDFFTSEAGKMDLRLEKDIFLLNIKEIRKYLDKPFWGDYLTEVFRKYPDGTKAGEWLWNNSVIWSDPSKLSKDDPLVRAICSPSMVKFNKARDAALGPDCLRNLRTRYKKEIYKLNLSEGLAQYPDANSSMRLSYGNVSDLALSRKDVRSAFTDASQILAKYDSTDYNFTLKKELVDLYSKADWGRWADSEGKLNVNFITTNDITGGNSGSPVLNAEGELVGLAFDGNKEGLACDVYYDSLRNRCVCVDIRYVMWIIEKYGKSPYLLKEILGE